MKKIKVAINGCGRIGRAFIKMTFDNDQIDIVAVNDLGSLENIAYLLKYDTAHGISKQEVEVKKDKLVINGNPKSSKMSGRREIKFLSEKDPSKLPWGDLGIDVVVESTGVFKTQEKAQAHIDAGAKRVVISSPSADAKTILMGINEAELNTCQISSNASCTTNAGSPVIEVLRETIGIEKAMLNTVHGYTATQKMVDSPDEKDFRKGRAGAQNIIPSTTGAAKATTRVITELDGKFDGIAMRVPVISGSLVDITFIAKKDTTPEEINEIFQKASKDPRWEGILAVTDEPIVSSDIVGNPYASIIDLQFTRVVGGNLVKVLAWYDNEMGYTTTLIKHVIKAGK